ncbi:retron Se72 family effector protein [Pseudomonas fluorescens]|uniref:retron Se72 family effector protein n=1 Tax=Pseudomonas fluorescens TaxID=294 RepID=UPI0021D12915|nr:retron Se72 family effector protein [Pseudomonas fluorescens]UXV19266.1 retron Se72 family effector protein [Pseudomonas fluorescens]
MSTGDQFIFSGFVTTFDAFKGYGFIRRAEGKDVFFFYDDIEDEGHDINVGDRVTFIIERAPKGPKAKSVKKAESNTTL